MSEPGPLQEKPQASVYREIAKEALEGVALYNARAHWFDLKGEPDRATEYRRLSQEALARAQRYKALAELAEKQT